MDKTLLVGGNVTGNVGSCEVKSDYYSVSFFKEQTTAVNSCTGQIIAQNTYISGFSILALLALIAAGLFLVILAIGGAFGILNKDF